MKQQFLQLWSGLIPILICAFILSCTPVKKDLKYVKLYGEAQGTTYSISYEIADSMSFQKEVDSVLSAFNKTASLYDSMSIISRINRNEKNVELNQDFIKIYNTARMVSEKSGGAFDITIGPLVTAWGFGLKNRENISPSLIDSLKKFVGYNKITINNNRLIKENESIRIDYNAIAQGYAVDLVCALLESKGAVNYMVELGGEIYAKGKNSKGLPWQIGIDKPSDNSGFADREIQEVVCVSNTAIATSGNYRKFYIKDGIRYSHTIDPKTGYPVNHNLLSASVTSESCAEADAWATTFMVLGLEKSKALLKLLPEKEAFLIYSDEKGELQVYITDGMKKMISQ